MKLLDRSKPMRAVHRETGEIGVVKAWHGSDAIAISSDRCTWAAHFDEYGNPKFDNCPWRVENVPTYTEEVMELGRANSIEKSYTGPQSNTTAVDTALFERMVALVRGLVSIGNLNLVTREAVSQYDNMAIEARAIAELLPPVIDPDLIEARKIAADALDESETANLILAGESDHSAWVKSALTAIKRGRELERGE